MKRRIWILLALIGVIALIIIVLIFKSSHDKMSYWPHSNVDSLKNSCAIECSKNDSYYYCDIKREVNDMFNPKFSDTCYNLANSDNYSDRGYDIQLCPQIDCFVAG